MFSASQLLTPASTSKAEALLTGRRRLDELLAGSLGRGQLIEFSGARSSGKASLALTLCVRVVEAGHGAAWVDLSNGFYPLAAVEAGVSLEQLLVVRLSTGKAAFRAANLILSSSGAVAVLVVDLSTERSRSRLRDRELVRLQRLAERSGTTVVFLTDSGEEQASLGAVVSLRLHAQRVGTAHPVRSMTGARMRIGVLRNKRGPSQGFIEDECHGPSRLRIRGSL